MKEMKEASASASASASDPRKPSTARPYVPPTISPQDLPIDYAGFLAVVLGVTGVMFRKSRWVIPAENQAPSTISLNKLQQTHHTSQEAILWSQLCQQKAQ